MENKKFNAFMIFMAVILTLLFCSLKITFLVSLISSLILVVVLRACWILFGLLWNLIEGVSFGGKTIEKTKKFKG